MSLVYQENFKASEIKDRLQKGDAMTCLLFNITLEKPVRATRTRDVGTIHNSQGDVKQYFVVLETAAKQINLR